MRYLKHAQHAKSKVLGWYFFPPSVHQRDERDYTHGGYLKSKRDREGRKKKKIKQFRVFSHLSSHLSDGLLLLPLTAATKHSEGSVYFKALLTHFRHLRNRRYKGSIWKFGRIVIDVLHFDDEFRLWFQGLLCVAVQGLRMQDIMCFLFPIQALRGVNISCHFVDDKYRSGSFAVQDVPDRSVAFIRVGVKLRGEADRERVSTQEKVSAKVARF